MANINISFTKDQLKEQESIIGVYKVRLDGFKPRKGRTNGIDLNPQMKIVGDATYNDRVVFSNLNGYYAPWQFEHFAKCFGEAGLETKPDGSQGLPGGFDGNPDDPTTWHYVGPLVGRVGTVEVGENTNKKDANNPFKNQVLKFLPA